LRADQFIDVFAHKGRHVVGFNGDTGCTFDRCRQFGAPFCAHAIIPSGNLINAGGTLGAVKVNRRRDQQAWAIAMDNQNGRPAKFNMQIVIIPGQVIDIIIVGY